MTKAARLTAQLAGIAKMDRPALTSLWSETHGRPPPKHLSVPLMRRALSFEVQCAALGGIKRRTLKALQAPAAKAPPKPRLPVGAQLMREWNGRTYRVEVTEAGFVMNATPYPSLSAIARHITGAHWSGPRFFGLAKRSEPL